MGCVGDHEDAGGSNITRCGLNGAFHGNQSFHGIDSGEANVSVVGNLLSFAETVHGATLCLVSLNCLGQLL